MINSQMSYNGSNVVNVDQMPTTSSVAASGGSYVTHVDNNMNSSNVPMTDNGALSSVLFYPAPPSGSGHASSGAVAGTSAAVSNGPTTMISSPMISPAWPTNAAAASFFDLGHVRI